MPQEVSACLKSAANMGNILLFRASRVLTTALYAA
jgi:hypothetical protein